MIQKPQKSIELSQFVLELNDNGGNSSNGNFLKEILNIGWNSVKSNLL